MIPLNIWNIYLKTLYESPNSRATILNSPIEDDIFSLEDIEFGVKDLANGKSKDIEGYQVEILKMGGSVLIPHIHKLFNLAMTQGFPKPWILSLIVPILKSGDKIIPSNYRTIMISLIIDKLYRFTLETKISLWLEIPGKIAKDQDEFKRHHSTIDHLVTLKIIAEECHNNNTGLF